MSKTSTELGKNAVAAVVMLAVVGFTAFVVVELLR
jgi:hypothetical protein